MLKYHSQEQWLSWVDCIAEHEFVVIDDFLPADLYQTVREEFLKRMPDFTPAGIGAGGQNTVEKGIRGDHTQWLDSKRDTSMEAFWQLLEETISVFNRYCFLSLSGFEFHFANYPPGGHYDTHIDQFHDRDNRMISMVVYLNEGWQQGDGGELELFDANGAATLVQPLGGRCVLFKSAVVPHGVLAANKNRYSLTGWLLHKPAALGHLLG